MSLLRFTIYTSLITEMSRQCPAVSSPVGFVRIWPVIWAAHEGHPLTRRD